MQCYISSVRWPEKVKAVVRAKHVTFSANTISREVGPNVIPSVSNWVTDAWPGRFASLHQAGRERRARCSGPVHLALA